MKKVLLSLVLLVALVSPTVANASTVNISSAQNTALTCFNNHTKSTTCSNALKVVNAWKPMKSSNPLIVNKNILVKCLYAKTTKTATCKSGDTSANNKPLSPKFVQTKSDLQQIQGAITTGIGTGDLTVSDSTGATALTGDISSENGGVSVGTAIVYVDLTQGKYCISEASGQTTYKATNTHNTITLGTSCQSING